jgi:branched-chain amino acid transport system substrate-binding protein
MNRSIKLLGALVVAAVLAAGGVWTWSHYGSSKSDDAITVAANLPLSGPLATYGVAVREGATFALEQAGPAGTPTLKFDWQDNAGDPKTAITIMQRQFLDNPAIYISGVKPQTMAILGQIAQRGLPHFVWIFDPQINATTKNNFRTWVSYKIEPQVYFDYVEKRHAKRISILYVQLPHTLEEFERLVVPGLKARGITDIQVQAYDFGRTDFKDLAAKIKAFGPDLLILNGFQTELVGMVRSLRPLSLISDGNTIATYDMLDAASILGPDELEGIRVVEPLFVTRPSVEPVASWRKSFQARFNKAPLYTDAFAFDMVQIIRDAGRRVGPNPTSAQWISALRATDIPGITGELKFDQDGDLITPLEVGVYRSGTLVPDSK